MISILAFGGLSVEESAEVLRISTITVKRDWRAAKLWLYPQGPSKDISNATWPYNDYSRIGGCELLSDWERDVGLAFPCQHQALRTPSKGKLTPFHAP